MVTLTISPDGEVLIPAALLAELGLTGGGNVLARVVDGALILETVDRAIVRAQALIARYMPEGVDLVGELIAERREAAGREGWGENSGGQSVAV